MKRLSLLAVAVSSLLVSQLGQAAEDPPEANRANISYSLGMMVGQRLQGEFSHIDLDRFRAGVEAMLTGSETEFTEEQASGMLNQHRSTLQAKQADDAKARGEEFLAENAGREGVTVTESGLQYEVLAAAEGPKPKANDKVKVHYEGTLIDGSVFDSSIRRGEPISFPLSGVIPGWTEGVQLMSVGSRYRFAIPSALAYGERGAGQTIGPNEVLVFEVELLGIETAEAAEAADASGATEATTE